MVGPSSQISKFLLSLLILLLVYYVYMDFNLYVRIKGYPIDDNDTVPLYSEVTWVKCEINPLCDVTVKAVLLDHRYHRNFYFLCLKCSYS